jgi:hypothetical protein
VDGDSEGIWFVQSFHGGSERTLCALAHKEKARCVQGWLGMVTKYPCRRVKGLAEVHQFVQNREIHKGRGCGVNWLCHSSHRPFTNEDVSNRRAPTCLKTEALALSDAKCIGWGLKKEAAEVNMSNFQKV